MAAGTTQSPAHKACGGHCWAPASSHRPLFLWQESYPCTLFLFWLSTPAFHQPCSDHNVLPYLEPPLLVSKPSPVCNLEGSSLPLTATQPVSSQPGLWLWPGGACFQVHCPSRDSQGPGRKLLLPPCGAHSKRPSRGVPAVFLQVKEPSHSSQGPVLFLSGLAG